MLLTKASLLSLLPSTLAFSITSITTSLGVTEESPATSADSENGRAQPIELRCDLEFNTGEQWTWCAWTHEFEKLWVDTVPQSSAHDLRIYVNKSSIPCHGP